MSWSLVLTLSASVVFSQADAGPTRSGVARALVIGVDTYDAPPPPVSSSGKRPTRERQWTNLEGAVNDANSMRDMLRLRFGVTDEHLVLLTNATATRDGILKGLRALAAASKPGDVAFVYYAGHGSQQRNSLTDELDGKDETLVPYDWRGPAGDLRDKELAAEFDAILDGGAALTVVLDSCHSGSGTRGVVKLRRMAESLDDAKDPTRVVEDPALCAGKADCLVAPEVRGAVVISAALDSQPSQEGTDEHGVPHGAFTLGLLKAVADGPGASVERLFARARVHLQAGHQGQEPELRGTPEARARTLLGQPADDASRFPVVVSGVRGDEVSLLAGTAMGLAAGCELSLPAKQAVLKVTQVDGLALSLATVVSTAKPLEVGDELTVTKWTAGADFSPLTLWLPDGVAAPQLETLRAQLAALQTQPSLSVVADPSSEPVDGVVLWEAGHWRLYALQRVVELGTVLDAKALVQTLALGRQPAIFVGLPPPAGLAVAGLDDATNATQRARSLFVADFLVAGAVREGGVRYALLNVAAFRSKAPVSLVRRSDWYEADERLGEQLKLATWKTARVKGWLTLQQPGTSDFPFELVVEPVGEAAQGGAAPEVLLGVGQRVRLALRSTQADPSGDLRSWFVYVISVDSSGKSKVRYGDKQETNQLLGSTKELVLKELRVTEPAGLDHLVVLATDTRLPSTGMLAMDPVLTRGEPAARGAFARLFQGVGATRGFGDETPGGWSISHTSLRTVRPWNPADTGGLKPVITRGALPNDGPSITLVSAGDSQAVPAPFDLRFVARKAPVNLASLKVELLTGQADVDITNAVLEAGTLSAEGLRSLRGRPGELRVRVSLNDVQGRRTAVEYQLRTR